MPSLSDDINAARLSGKTDEYILSSYKEYDPSKASDIDEGLSAGHSPTQILDALSDYDAQYGNHIENKSVTDKVTKALQSGVASELTGLGKTAEQTLGPGTISSILTSLGNAVAPNDYQPASDGLGDTSKSIADRAGYIPRSVVEGAPGIATDLAAGALGARAGGAIGALGGPFAEVTVPVGAAIGGAVGFGGSYLLRNYGSDVQRSAQARTGDPNASPDAEDKERAITAGLLSAALSRVGVTRALGEGVEETGIEALTPTIRGFAKAGAVDAGTGATTDAVNKVLVEHADPSSDLTGVVLAAAQGAGIGAGLRATTAAGDLNRSIKFRDIDPLNGDNLAGLYAGKDFTTPSKAYQAMKDVDRVLNLTADYWHEETQPQLDALSDASGGKDNTAVLLKMTRQRLDAGNVVDPYTMGDLQQRLGDYREGSNLIDTLALQNTQNQVKAVGNFRDGPAGTGTFGGGIADTPFGRNTLNPMGKFGHIGPKALALDVGLEGLLPSSIHLEPASAALLGGAQVGSYLAIKGLDRMLKNDNPLQAFAQRFGSTTAQKAAGETTGEFARKAVVRSRAIVDPRDTKAARKALGATLSRIAIKEGLTRSQGARAASKGV